MIKILFRIAREISDTYFPLMVYSFPTLKKTLQDRP